MPQLTWLAFSLRLLTGGQSLLLATHSSTGMQGRRTRVYEDMLQIELMSGLEVQVGTPCTCKPYGTGLAGLNCCVLTS